MSMLQNGPADKESDHGAYYRSNRSHFSYKEDTANIHDNNMTDRLIREDDYIFLADSGYPGIKKDYA